MPVRPKSLARADQTDQRWRNQLAELLNVPGRSLRPILIEYLYEEPLTVPQRLYRYELHEDYVVRQRDDFEFGFDLITQIEFITRPPSYRVYVIELSDSSNHVYVGQTWYAADERLRQHLTGLAVFHAAKPFKRGLSGRLRPDLYAHLPTFSTQSQAEELEATWAIRLKQAGYRVEGGR